MSAPYLEMQRRVWWGFGLTYDLGCRGGFVLRQEAADETVGLLEMLWMPWPGRLESDDCVHSGLNGGVASWDCWLGKCPSAKIRHRMRKPLTRFASCETCSPKPGPIAENLHRLRKSITMIKFCE